MWLFDSWWRGNGKVSRINIGGGVNGVYWSKDKEIRGHEYDVSRMYVTDIDAIVLCILDLP